DAGFEGGAISVLISLSLPASVSLSQWRRVHGLTASASSLESHMRLFFGLILGCALTIGGAYLVDNMQSGPRARPLIDWGVVRKNIDGVVALARDSWKKIAG